jgi:hypothetical protein
VLASGRERDEAEGDEREEKTLRHAQVCRTPFLRPGAYDAAPLTKEV